jgi:hypothetical protein
MTVVNYDANSNTYAGGGSMYRKYTYDKTPNYDIESGNMVTLTNIVETIRYDDDYTFATTGYTLSASPDNDQNVAGAVNQIFTTPSGTNVDVIRAVLDDDGNVEGYIWM